PTAAPPGLTVPEDMTPRTCPKSAGASTFGQLAGLTAWSHRRSGDANAGCISALRARQLGVDRLHQAGDRRVALEGLTVDVDARRPADPGLARGLHVGLDQLADAAQALVELVAVEPDLA